MRRLRIVSYANVTATLALVVALAGTSYAAVIITTKDIADSAVTSGKLANKAVVAGKIGDAAVNAKALAPKAVTPAAVDSASRFPIDQRQLHRRSGDTVEAIPVVAEVHRHIAQ